MTKSGMYHRIFAKKKTATNPGEAAVAAPEEEEEEEEEEPPYFFVPGKVYHLRRGPLGMGVYYSHLNLSHDSSVSIVPGQ